MKYTIRQFSFLSLLAGVLLLAGLGCKGQSTQEAAATRARTLEVWTVFDDIDALQPIIAQYKAERPYLTVNLRQLRADELYPRLLEALAEDKGPDVVSVRNRSIRELLSKLAPMPATAPDATVRVEKGTVGEKIVITVRQRPLPTIDQLNREFVQTVKKDAVVEGKVYGLPLSMDVLAVYYNKDLLDKAGIAEPPKDWVEFQAAAKKLTKLDRVTGKILQSGAAIGAGVNIPGADDVLFALFKQSQAPFTDTGGRAVFNEPRRESGEEEDSTTRIMNFFTDFANPARDTYAWNEQMPSSLEAFAAGTTAFFFGYQYHYPVIQARAPQLNFGVLPLFQVTPESPVNAANYWVFSVTNKSKHKNDAWGLIDYLARGGNAAYLQKSGRLTARRAAIQTQLEKPELAPFAEQVLIAENWYAGKDYAAAERAIKDMIHEWLQTPPDAERFGQIQQEILNRAAAKINQTL